MKVFGGNGKRENNSARDSSSSRADYANRDYINDYDRGYNSEEPPIRRTPQQAPTGRRAPQPKKKGGAGKTVLIVFIVLAVIAAGVFGWWKLSTKPPEKVKQPDSAAPVAAERYYTLLVVGIDQLQANTDTIMVVRYDTVENKANIISIPRDTLVNVEQPVKKINAVYSNAVNNDKDGIDALMDAVEDICGFRPNNYVFIDTKVFVQAIDALGGVYFDVPINMNYDDYADNDGDGTCEYVFTIHVQKGYQLLDGNNALGVFRFRQNNDKTGYGMGDLDRLETQHALIKEVASQALQLKNLTKLVDIAKLVLDTSKTDLSMSNMQWYAQEFLKMSTEGISISTLPTTGAYINNLSYVYINVDEWLTIVNEQLNPFDKQIAAEDCSILCQKNQETGKYTITPGNYYTTNGKEAYTNFYKNDK